MRILLRTSRNSFWMVKEQLLSRVFWQTDQKKKNKPQTDKLLSNRNKMKRSAVDTFNESLSFCDTSTCWPHIFVNIFLSYILVRSAYQSSPDCSSCWRNLEKGGRMKKTIHKFRIQDLEPSLCREGTLHKAHFAWAFNANSKFIFSGFFFPCEPMKILLYCCWTYWHHPAIYMTTVELSWPPSTQP